MRPKLAFAFVALLAVPAAAQTTWYVDVSAAPPGSGTLASPYASVQFALDQASTVSGDTLSVAPGVYVENLTISKRVRIVSTGGAAQTILRAAAPGNLVRATAVDDGFLAALRGWTLDGSPFPSETALYVDNSGSAALRFERSVVQGFTSGRAVFVGSDGYLDAFQSTIVNNGVGVQVAPAISHGQASFAGCIVRFNAVELIGNELGYNPNYSNVDASVAAFGGGNISSDPALWDLAAGDLHLRAGSPCIDTLPAWIGPPDIDGSAGDMGAYPFEPGYGWTSYCTSGVTSNGCVPVISAAGNPSASAASGFTLSISDVEGAKDGHIFYGLSGPHAAPWGSSSHFLCVKAPSQRTGTQNSGGAAGSCDGVIALDWCAYVATHPTALGAPFSVGASVWAQLYFRDPPGPKTTALSNALSFTVIP